jgi:ribosomal protein L7/L12
MEDKHHISYEFTCTAAPVEAFGSADGKAFHFRARHDSWSFSLAEDPQIAPEDIYSSEQGFYLCARYGHGPHTASYMSLKNADTIIRACLLRYFNQANDAPILVESEDHIFSVYLEDPGPRRLHVIARVREQNGLSPAQARALVDSPRPVLFRATRRDVEQFTAELTDLGARIAIE